MLLSNRHRETENKYISKSKQKILRIGFGSFQDVMQPEQIIDHYFSNLIFP